MPWKECNIVEQRLRFIARLLDGEKMAGARFAFEASRRKETSGRYGLSHKPTLVACQDFRKW